MPTKSRVVPVPLWGDDWYTAGPVWEIHSSSADAMPGPGTEQQGTETIIYENSNRSRPNPCEQTSDWRATKAYLEAGFTPGGLPDWDYWFETNANGLYARVGHSDFVHFVPNSPWSVPRSQLLETDYSIDAAIADAVGRLHTGCREQVFALPRAIAELKDVPQTVRSLIKLRQWVGTLQSLAGLKSYAYSWSDSKSLVGKLNGSVRPVREIQGMTAGQVNKWALTKTVSELASTYLAVVFGIKPTTSDVNTFLGRPENGRRPLKLAVTQPKLYKGQKLECSFRISPPPSLFPTLKSINLNYDHGLLRDWSNHSGIRPRVYETIRGDAYRSVTHQGMAFGEVAGLPTRQDWTYGEQLSLSGGGLFSTSWRLTPWTWVADSMYNLGRSIDRIERAGLPLELRPTLRFGSWISHKECESIFLPRYQALEYTYEIIQQCEPNMGYGAVARSTGSIVPLGYQVAFESNMRYHRYEQKGAFNELGMPVLRCPGGYTLGPLAAVCVQFGANKTLQRR